MMPLATVHLYHQPLVVEVAKTPATRYQGLSDRKTMGPYAGMLFIFKKPGYHGLVMRRMHFPLDVAWFLNNQMVDSRSYLQPEPGVSESQLTLYRPSTPADSFLELKAGTLASLQHRATLPS